VTVNGLNGKPIWTTTSTQGMAGAFTSASNVAPTWSVVAKAAGVTGSFYTGINTGASDNYGGNLSWHAANTWHMYNGSGSGSGSFNFTASDGAWHAAQSVYNATTSIANLDGVETTGTTWTQFISAADHLAIGADSITDTGGFSEAELGVVAGILTNIQRQMLCHSQYTRWGTATAC
jgi:hypothetical protein